MHTTKETFVNPNYILSLSSFNSSEDIYMPSDSSPEEMLPNIKRISLSDINNVQFNSYIDI